MTPAGLLLAAGAGRRLGTPKALLEIGGERLADRAAATLAAGGCAPVLVVTGAVPVLVAGTTDVPNPAWETGMGSSLRAGLAAVPDETEAVVVALVDQPDVTPAAVARLIAAWRAGAGIAVATYGGAPRNPVLLTRPHFAAASAAATGDHGARTFLRRHPHLVTHVPCEDVADPADLDTAADLTAYRARRRNAADPADLDTRPT
ncbi:nucleotidyltransferase family protein [Actinomadura flavalba]|uniref:nucleotidyltransferase family protein n=1 Tax=Actinomadura flavalba TaxID=1120938 RepID=UPI0003A07343|nr:nucleotidyltransferase family protein [Actinomadura flavalba]